MIEKRLPAPAERVERELVEAGITAIGMSLESVADAAKLLGRPVPFRMVRAEGGRLAVRPDQVDVPAVVVEAGEEGGVLSRADDGQAGGGSLAGRFPGRLDLELMRQIVQMIDGFRWLDRKTGWFRLVSINKHGLPRAIEKILAVAGPIRVGGSPFGDRDAIAACGRSPPPKSVLLEFCRQSPAEGQGRRDRRRAGPGLEEGPDGRGKGTGEHPQGARPGDGTRRDRGPLRRAGG